MFIPAVTLLLFFKYSDLALHLCPLFFQCKPPNYWLLEQRLREGLEGVSDNGGQVDRSGVYSAVGN